jgi:hypothetical protein
LRPRSRPRTAVTVGLLVTALAAGPGCSFLLVDGPPPADVPPPKDFVCTTSDVVPAADALAALAVVVHEVGGAGKPDREWTGVALSLDHQAMLAFALMTAFAASAFVGHERVRECREATAARHLPAAPTP